jgi:pimeloyl-ACP methyl ester carboxylesterase
MKHQKTVAVLSLGILVGTVSCGLEVGKRSVRSGNNNDQVSINLNDPESCRWKFAENGVLTDRGAISKAQFATHFTEEDINKALPQGLPKAKNGVDAFIVEYHSIDLNQKPAVLSGLILVPATCGKQMPTISLQHWTLMADSESPTSQPTYGLFQASQGYYTLAADYLGYGKSKELFHPYLIEAGYTHSLVDMLRAGRNLAKLNEVVVDKDLFLQGYSEGGYATMALLKVLESEPYKNEFKVTAAAPGAGPYNLYAMGIGAMTQEKSNPFTPFIVTSYVESLPLNMELSTILAGTDTYDYPDLFSGKYDGYAVMTKIPQTMAELMNPDYRKTMLENYQALSAGQPANLTPFEQALIQNSLTTAPWKIKTPTKLYQCRDDDVVPVAIAEQAFAAFSQLSNKVALEILTSPEGAMFQHNNCPALFTPVAWFDSILNKTPDALVDTPFASPEDHATAVTTEKGGKDGAGKGDDYSQDDKGGKENPPAGQPGQNQNQNQNQNK